jgi:hypothetical protein
VTNLLFVPSFCFPWSFAVYYNQPLRAGGAAQIACSREKLILFYDKKYCTILGLQIKPMKTFNLICCNVVLWQVFLSVLVAVSGVELRA